MTEGNLNNIDSLKPQPGQYDQYHPHFHPLPGVWAKEQLEKGRTRDYSRSHNSKGSSKPQTDLQRALAAEREQHHRSEVEQGVIPGKRVYENPRDSQNTLLPTDKYSNG